MAVETVRVDWIRDRIFVLTDHYGVPLAMTQPAGLSGADLLPLSLIGCAAWDVQAILDKMREPLTGLWVTAESVRADETPRAFQRIHLRYHLAGRGLNASRIEHAILLSEEKYCSIHATLRAAVTLTSEYEIVNDTAPALRAAVRQAPSEPFASSAAGATQGLPALTAAETDHTDAGVEIVLAFNAALNARDLDRMMRLMTPDCVFENTNPPPDGSRYVGQAAVRAFWEDFFRASREARFDVEDIFAQGQRCVMRWCYHWRDAAGRPGHIRGVDVYTLRAGLIAAKLSYVKG